MTEQKQTIAGVINVICWAIIGTITGIYVPLYLVFLAIIPLAILSACMLYIMKD